MSLKIYQTNAIAKISEFFIGYQRQLAVIDQVRNVNPDTALTMESSDQSGGQFKLITRNQYFEYLNLGNKFYPNITIKAPTGAGKTLLSQKMTDLISLNFTSTPSQKLTNTSTLKFRRFSFSNLENPT
jgi:ATP-dependent protease Clp ATPase subunit